MHCSTNTNGIYPSTSSPPFVQLIFSTVRLEIVRLSCQTRSLLLTQSIVEYTPLEYISSRNFYSEISIASPSIHGLRTIRLWRQVNLSPTDKRDAPSVLHSVVRRYAAELDSVDIADLVYLWVILPFLSVPTSNAVFSTSDHSKRLDNGKRPGHTTLRGYDRTGWPAFAIHFDKRDAIFDKVFLYHVGRLSSPNCWISPPGGVVKHVYHRAKYVNRNFNESIYTSVRFLFLAPILLANFL